MRDYTFGNYICNLREARGYSQFQLGALVGVSDKAVSKWENGNAKPRMQTCIRYSLCCHSNLCMHPQCCFARVQHY